MNKNTIYKKKSKLDQFFTKEQIAKLCYDLIFKTLCAAELIHDGHDGYSKYNELIMSNIHDDGYKLYQKFMPLDEYFSLFLEPSAGKGTFLKLFPKDRRKGIDLDPKDDMIEKLDFFKYIPPANKKTITIGNPPFGKMCNLAVKFFNKAAEFSEVIAFIVPKTFKKRSIHNKLNLDFQLIYSIDLPKNSFEYNNEEYDVPCCFQIWQKNLYKKRVINKIDINNKIFDFVERKDSELAVRRVGGNAGKSKIHGIDKLSKTSHYFLKIKSKKISKEELSNKINNIDNTDIINSTAGVRSLSKQEFIEQLRKNGII